MPRCFLALSLPDEVREELSELSLPEGAGIRPVWGESLHLTLLFLGEQTDSTITTLSIALQDLTVPVFTFDIRGVGCFPPRGAATVLWCGVAAPPELIALHRELGERLRNAIGFQPEERPYAPHITLARCSPSPSREALDRWYKQHQALQVGPLAASAVTLYFSQLNEQPVRYIPMATFPLKPDQTITATL
jgi:2'-5' RNA ligase